MGTTIDNSRSVKSPTPAAERFESPDPSAHTISASAQRLEPQARVDAIVTNTDAEMAYAIADVMGIPPSTVEKIGYAKFNHEILDSDTIKHPDLKNINRLEKADQIRSIYEDHELRFARAMSAAQADSGVGADYSRSGMSPIDFALSSRISTGNTVRLIEHAIERLQKGEHAVALFNAIDSRVDVGFRRDFLMEKLEGTMIERGIVPTRSAPASEASPAPSATMEVADRLRKHDLLSLMKDRTFTEVRAELADVKYSKLVASQRAHEEKVAEMNAAHLQSGRSEDHGLTRENLNERMEALGKDLGRKGGGSYVGQSNGGPNIVFGNALMHTTSTTAFYINPRLSEMAPTLDILADALKGTSAIVKIHTRPIDAELGDPKVTPNNKIVVIMDSTNAAQLDKFARTLAERSKELEPLLKPESLASDMCALRIPLMPGVTFVERTKIPRPGLPFDSWDDTVREKIRGEWNEVKQTLVDPWRKGGPAPSEARWQSLMGVKDPSRNPDMPGLRID